MNLAACCDLRYSNEGARFGVPAASSAWATANCASSASRIVDLPRAMVFLSTAKRYSSRKAYQTGLARTGVAPDAELDAMVNGITGAISQNAPLAMRSPRPQRLKIAKPGQAGPRQARQDGRGLFRQQRGLQGRPPRLHGKAQAGLQGPLRNKRKHP